MLCKICHSLIESVPIINNSGGNTGDYELKCSNCKIPIGINIMVYHKTNSNIKMLLTVAYNNMARCRWVDATGKYNCHELYLHELEIY